MSLPFPKLAYELSPYKKVLRVEAINANDVIENYKKAVWGKQRKDGVMNNRKLYMRFWRRP